MGGRLLAKVPEENSVWEESRHGGLGDMSYGRDLNSRFDGIAAMNRHGMSSPERWESHPDYWSMRNAPPTKMGPGHE